MNFGRQEAIGSGNCTQTQASSRSRFIICPFKLRRVKASKTCLERHVNSFDVAFSRRKGIVSRSIDDRIGAFVVLEALRRYAAAPGEARVVAVATTQEEIAYRGGGALVGAERVNPAMAIVVDVTFATDHPGMEKKELGHSPLGSGPVLTRGSVISPVAFRILRDTAELSRIPFTLHAAGRETSTDADAIHLAREGVAPALLSVPNRYMHSPNEMVSLVDLDYAATLIAAACRAVTSETDFTAR